MYVWDASWTIQVTHEWCIYVFFFLGCFNYLKPQAHSKTTQTEMHELCEQLLPSQGVFWIDPDFYSSVLDSLSARPNGSLPASVSPQPFFRWVGSWLVSSQSVARWLRALCSRESFVCPQPLLSPPTTSSVPFSTAEGSGEVSHGKKPNMFLQLSEGDRKRPWPSRHSVGLCCQERKKQFRLCGRISELVGHDWLIPYCHSCKFHFALKCLGSVILLGFSFV